MKLRGAWGAAPTGAALDPQRPACGSNEGHRRVIDPVDLDAIRDEPYPMLSLPGEWQQLEDGTPAPNWSPPSRYRAAVVEARRRRVATRSLALQPECPHHRHTV